MRLSKDDHIISLEREILALRGGKQVFDGVEILRRLEKGKAKETTPIVGPSKVTKPVDTTLDNRTPPETVPDITTTPPIHPFTNIPEAQYAPPTNRNFAAPVDKDKGSKDREPAYRTVAPIQNSRVADDVYSRSMKTPFVTLSPEELLSLSPEYRQKMRDSVTPK